MLLVPSVSNDCSSDSTVYLDVSVDLWIVGILCDAQSNLELCRIISSVGSVGGLEERERERERERSVLLSVRI